MEQIMNKILGKFNFPNIECDCKICGIKTNSGIYLPMLNKNLEYCQNCQVNEREMILLMEKYQENQSILKYNTKYTNNRMIITNNSEEINYFIDNKIFHKLFVEICKDESKMFLIVGAEEKLKIIYYFLLKRYLKFCFFDYIDLKDFQNKHYGVDILVIKANDNQVQEAVEKAHGRLYYTKKTFILSEDFKNKGEKDSDITKIQKYYLNENNIIK